MNLLILEFTIILLLFLDFYKGTPTLYLKYFNEDDNHEFEYSGYGTVEIIYNILDKTNFSGKQERRRY